MTVSATDESSLRLLEAQTPTIQTLIKGCSSVEVVSSPEAVPSGCLAESINSNVTAHLLVAVRLTQNSLSVLLSGADLSCFEQGVLDLKKEISKSEKRIEALTMSADRLKAQMATDGYEERVKEEVREGNKNQVRSPHRLRLEERLMHLLSASSACECGERDRGPSESRLRIFRPWLDPRCKAKTQELDACS